MLCLAALATVMPAAAQEEADGHLCVYAKNGTVDIYANELIKQHSQTASQLIIELANDGPIQTYNLADIDSISTKLPARELPKFTSFKFNNKYNHNVFVDVPATLHDNGDSISAEMGCIGKSLTPSFQLSDPLATAYVNSLAQESKKSRHRFENDVEYTLGYEGMREMRHIKVKDAVWSEGGSDSYTATPIALSATMLSTNGPSNFEAAEGLHSMLDNNKQTFFHSTWGTGNYTIPEDPIYIQIDLEEAIEYLQFSYTSRPDNGLKCPQTFEVQVSSDNSNFTTVATIGDLPQGQGVSYTSEFINLGGNYSHIRLLQAKTYYSKNYLCIAELSLNKGTFVPGSDGDELISPAEYEWKFTPYGRRIPVHIEWLADRAAAVPRIDINTKNGEVPTNATKDIYIPGEMIIDGVGIFPDFRDSMLIKGRGNSSWSLPKKPYRLKFNSSVKPFGLTKGKSWVLLANGLQGSMLTNALAMKAAKLMQTAAANDIIPVELYMNGKYYGSYCFTQHVGFSNNSIDLDDESNAVRIELDDYYDEAYRYKDPSFSLPVNIKDPDLAELEATDKEAAQARFALIRTDFNKLTAAVKGGTDAFNDLIDVDRFARFISLNELVFNLELYHPKSCFLYREDLTALHSRYIFGPVWDFDWAFGYQDDNAYCMGDPTVNYTSQLGYMGGEGGSFFYNMLTNSEAVSRARYKVMTDFITNHKQELLDYVTDYYNFARPSLEHNAELWYDGAGYAGISETMKTWLDNRADAVYNSLEAFDLTTPLPVSKGDVNGDNLVTMADVVCIANNILGKTNESFNFNQADADANGKISINDAVHIVAIAMQATADEAAYAALPAANATLTPEIFAANVNAPSEMPVALKLPVEGYTAMQFDLTLPAALSPADVALTGALSSSNVTFERISAEAEAGNAAATYRVAVYATDGSTLPAGTHMLYISLNGEKALTAEQRTVSITGATIANRLGEDSRIASRSISFELGTTGIDHAAQNAIAVSGGHRLIIESAAPANVNICAADGRIVRSMQVQAGRTAVSLPAGVYVVAGQKVVVQ